MKFSAETEKLIPTIQRPCEGCEFTNLRECVQDCKKAPIVPACPHCGRDFVNCRMLAYAPLRPFAGNADTVVAAMFAKLTMNSVRVHRYDDTVYFNLNGKPLPKIALYCGSCFYAFREGENISVDKHFFSRLDESKFRKDSAVMARLLEIRKTAEVNGIKP